MRAPWALTWAISGAWLVWVLWSVGFYAPSHDEVITLLNMRNVAMPEWAPLASIGDHQAVFDGPLAGFGDIAPMLLETDVHPPVYYYLLLAWSYVWGGELWSLRLFSVLLSSLAGMALLGLTSRVIQSTSDRWLLPLLAACMWSASTVAYAAVNARSYALVFLVGVAVAWSLHACVRGEDRPSWRAGLCLGLSLALLVWTHYFGLIVCAAVLGSMGLWMLVARRDAWKAWSVAVVVATTGAVTLLPWLMVHFSAREDQFSGFLGWWREIYHLVRVVAEQITFLTTSPSSPMWVFFTGVIVLFLMVRACTAPDLVARRVARLSTASFVLFLTMLLGLFWWTDKTLSTGDSSRYGMFLIVFLLPVLAVAARGWTPVMGVVTLLAISPWWGGARVIQPWDWQPGFQETLQELDRPDTLVVSNIRLRGVVGHMIHRGNPNGWMGFADPGIDPGTVIDVIPVSIRRVVFHGFLGGDQSPERWDLWKAFLRAQGFVEGEGSVWERSGS